MISNPKTGSGINPDLVTTYLFTDVSWFNPQDVNFTKFDHLNRVCVQVDDTYYIRDRTTGTWMPSAAARRTLFQQYGGQKAIGGTLQIITMDDIKLFLSIGVVAFHGTIYAPGMGDFLIYRDEKRLNVYKDQRMAGDTDNIPATEELLKIIRNSLCAEPEEKGLGDMLAEIDGPEPTKFKWVMHWLAARYQMPGFAPQTNLWFIGELRGIGKGSLVQLMKRVMGGQTVGKASQEDIERGWSDCFLNKELMEWDEFKSPDGWRSFNNLLKEKTGNTELTVTKRNVGVSVHPAVAMHIFSTNEERPILVEEFDRQNTFISVTKDTRWQSRARALFNPVTGEFATPGLASGFAALLNTIAVDVAFIRTLLKTEKWYELRAGSEDSVRKWVLGGGADCYRTDKRPDGRSVKWNELHDTYRFWIRDHENMKSDSLDEFKRKMEKHGYGTSKNTSFKQFDGTWKSMIGCALTLPPVETAEAEAEEAEEHNKIIPSR
jgi:hypothetical protein